jgi:sugar phosphate isomerase/epimerase
MTVSSAPKPLASAPNDRLHGSARRAMSSRIESARRRASPDEHAMLLGYNTNGLAHHRLLDAIELLAELGYQSIAITLDAGVLDPYDDPASLGRQVRQVRAALDRHGLARVIETGARFLLNPRAKHDPTLMDPDPARRAVRRDFLCRAVDLAKFIQSDTVSLWSGAPGTPIEEDSGLDRLSEALKPVLEHAERAGVVLAFEPEPGMFIDSLERFARLDERIAHPLFQLTMDVGHVHCMREGHIPSLLTRWQRRVVNIHIEDMIDGKHEHLMFGQGTIDFPPIFRALEQIGFGRTVSVELSRHSHMAVDAARAAALFLKPLTDRSVRPTAFPR